jgi:Flp pilus assembly protein TadG
MQKASEKYSGQEGASTAEFALILPVLLLLFFGIIDFGVLFYDKQIITNASRVGARAGIARTSQSINSIVIDYCSNTSPGDRLITFNSTKPLPITTLTGGGTFQQPFTVGVAYTYNFLTPALLGFSPQITVRAQTTMNMERE